ncbi:ANTAR domain-containing protein [Phycicoccus sp. M110.8]|uniref:ANTAR domain-containing protein n=1 Tax=Phycicoccus sp. M110.8 TaxID=3075433 RepID=UPI0028FD673D|nr:ANTAR domain-containing protein [Phycicoccus sp. M110.8]MDU0315373.1 ANTAR domain-containing protein [Phycicoccus sp. M110.8]
MRRDKGVVVNPKHVAALLRTLATELSNHHADLGMPRRLCLAAAALSRAPGVALTVAYASAERITLCATDDVAARLEDLQDVLSQGPGRLAFTDGVHVRALLDHVEDPRWPELSGAVRDELGPVLVEAFPMRSGGEVVGVLTYHLEPGAALALDTADGQLVADLVGGAAVEHDPADELQIVGGTGPWADRSAIHQATGMVMAQLRLGAGDAATLLKAHAFASGEPLATTAHRVLDRTLDFRTTDSSEGSSP